MQAGQMRRALGDAIFLARLLSCNRPMKVTYHARRSRGPSSTLSGSETMADAINGRWSYSVGERGRNRVRAFAHPETGRMHLEYYEPARTGERPKVRRLALGHSDKELAKEAAEKLAAELRRSAPPTTAKLKLVTLFDMYLREVTPGKSAGTQQHDRMCAEMFTRAFGRDREPNTLSLREWNWFIRQRRDGVRQRAG